MYDSFFRLGLKLKLACIFFIGFHLPNAFAQQKILFVTSNQDHYGDTDIHAANHFGEIVVPYDLFLKAGYGVDIISPKGGHIPIDYIDPSDSLQEIYLFNNYFMDRLENTLKPTEVKAENYAAIFYSGGGAAMYGVAENTAIQGLARDIYKNNGMVTAICHGTAGLAYLKDENGKSLYAGRKITGYPDQFENKDKAYYKAFPFAMDDAINKNGGTFVFSKKGWDGHYIVDDRFITAQDPSGAVEITKAIIAKLQEKLSKNSRAAITKIDKIFAEWDNKTNKPGMAAGLLKDGKIAYLKGFGNADLVNKTPITTDSRFQLGFMSKQFTAFAILLLEEQGKISLTDDVRKYIPQLPDYDFKITINHLLSQTSGLPDIYTLKDIAGWKEKDVFTQKDAMDLICQQKKLDYAPGTKFSVTSSGMILLTEVIKQASGQSFADYTYQNIFKELDMTNTIFCDDAEMLIPNVAIPYQQSNNGYKNIKNNTSTVGPNNLYISVADMAKWYLNFDNPKVGSPQLIKKLFTPITLDDGVTKFNPTSGTLLHGQQYIHIERGVPKIWTYGLEGGYGCNIFTIPAQKIITFVLGNNNAYNGGYAMDMATELDGYFFNEPNEIDYSKVKTIRVDAKKLESYNGNYIDRDRMIARNVYVRNDTLRYKNSGNKTEQTLIPIAENLFQWVVEGDDKITMKFTKVNDKWTLAQSLGGSDEMIYDSYNPIEYSMPILNEFIGTYYCESLQTTYTIGVNEKGLFTSNRNHPMINFTPIEKDLFITNTRHFSGLKFTRDNSQHITGFSIQTERAKNITFIKINN